MIQMNQPLASSRRRTLRAGIGAALLTVLVLVVPGSAAQAVTGDFPVVVTLAISPTGSQVVGQPVTFDVGFSSPSAPASYDLALFRLGIIAIQTTPCYSLAGGELAQVPLNFLGTQADSPVSTRRGTATVTFPSSTTMSVRACYYPAPGAPFLGGASAPQLYSVGPDLVAPVVTGSADRDPNAAGWYTNPVTIAWTSVDPMPSSGAPTQPPSSIVTTEGANQLITSGQSCDPAGRCASGTYGPVNLDATGPTVAITGVSPGDTYPLGSVPAAGCSTTDSLSGVATNASLAVVRNSSGVHAATCSGGADVAGNVSGANLTYSVSVASAAGRAGFLSLFNKYVATSPTQPKRAFIRNVTAAVNRGHWCTVIRKVNNPRKNSLTTTQRAELTYWAQVARGGPCGSDIVRLAADDGYDGDDD
jgi:hypothetical protein